MSSKARKHLVVPGLSSFNLSTRPGHSYSVSKTKMLVTEREGGPNGPTVRTFRIPNTADFPEGMLFFVQDGKVRMAPLRQTYACDRKKK